MSHPKNIVSAADLGSPLTTEADIMTLLGECYGADGLLLTESDLSADFLNLRSGLLGELFQKCVNYRLPVAFVVADPAAHGPRFVELAREHATHPQIRFLSTPEQARMWLAGVADGPKLSA